jgi:hypothetical protein
MLIDIFLPHHQTEEFVARYSKEVYSTVGSGKISLIETREGEKLWAETQNYGLYRSNPIIIVERSWIFHSPIRFISNQKYLQYQIPVHFTFFWGWMLIVPLFFIPLFVKYYKKNDPLFVILYHASIFMITPGTLYFIFTEDRWAHFLTLGFL